jgi:hypothetical protein
MNRYNTNNVNEGEDKDNKDAEGQKAMHQGQPDSTNPQDWNPGKSSGNDENEGGVRPE